MFYLDPTADLVFKKLFGTEANKDLLISFLNGILGRAGDQLIADVVFSDPYNHQPLADLKLSIVDVRCTDKTGNSYIVEMQVNPQSDYLARCHYYTACGLSLQLKKSDDYEKLLPVIFIGITNFKLFDDHSRYLSHYRLLDSIDHVCRLHHEEFYFIELPKFTKTVEQLESISDKWIYFLRHAAECEAPPQQLQKTAPLIKAFDALERGRWTKDELIAYEKMIDAERVARSVLKTAKTQGRQEGLQEGRQEGRMEERNALVKKMLAKNATMEFICTVTGLSAQEIEALKKK
jgi:predicted transposase/invertase (TIGR01784 family)